MGKYVIAKTKTGFKFNLEAANGQVICTSQSYTTKVGCKKAIESLQKIAKAPIEDQTVRGYVEEKKPKYEVYQDRKKEYRFRLIASNGKNIVSGESYTTLQACKSGILSIQSNATSEIVDSSVAEKKPAAKKPAAKKATAAAKKPAAKKPAAAKKTAAKKPAAKK